VSENDPSGTAPPDRLPIPSQTPLFHALERDRYRRQEQIGALEQRTGRRLICYVAGPAASITARDILPFVDLLEDVERGSDLDLLLHTSGGDVDQAERLAGLCRKRVGPAGSFRVIVPDSAKSAGTLICLAADRIVMGQPSELGPIDPQIVIQRDASGDEFTRPAQSFLDGLQDIVQETGAGQLSPAYFPLLDKLDPALIDFCKKALRRSEELATRYLAHYMLRGQPDCTRRAREIAHELNNVERFLSHGAVIDAERALGLGLVVEILDPDDDVWQGYWRLYCEQSMALGAPTARLFEGRRASILASYQAGQ
jgi:hypothetical protein